jgi:hypothetical protein
VALPPEVTLVTVSASNASCSGTTVLRCDFTELEALATVTVALTVRASAAGSYVSSLKLSATNDFNAANDSRAVAIEIAGSGAAQASASRGGGGRLESWMLGLLALLAARRKTSRNYVIGWRVNAEHH